jgi:TIR domain
MLNPVFLSYARFDEVAAQSIYSKIEEWGFDVWMDKYEIYPGDKWAGKTMKALDRAQIVLLLISADWLLHNGFVKDEFYRALSNSGRKGTRIIPLLLNLDNPPEKLSDYHCIKWLNKEEREKLRELLCKYRQKKVVRATMISLSISLVLFSAAFLWSRMKFNNNDASAIPLDSSYSASVPVQKSRFDALVLDQRTRLPIVGATATVMRNKAEVMVRSAPSDSTGNVVVAVDTVPEIRMKVTISCAGYDPYTESYLLKTHFYHREILLSRKTKKLNNR